MAGNTLPLVDISALSGLSGLKRVMMKVKLQVKNIRFRQGDEDLSSARQREILANRLAGCNRVLREGEPFAGLAGILALRSNGAAGELITPLPFHPPEPYRIKSVELRGAGCPSFDQRLQAIEAAGYNTFLLKEDKGVVVHIDLLTDSGTSAMSDLQWSAMLKANEDYAGSRSYYPLEKAVQEVYGWREVIPTHQGRGAEHILSTIYIKPLLEQYPGDPVFVPKNMYFTTTKAHILRAGGIFKDIIIDVAHDPTAYHPFKGNIDLGKLRKLIDDCIANWGKEHGPRHIAYLHLEGCVNMAGGQPFSMGNLQALRAATQKYDIPLLLDATRLVENAYFIQQREEGYRERTIAGIVREMGSLTDGCTMSSKKDHLVNIGGFLALNDPDKAGKAREMLVDFEGFPTYGGMAGYSMEALAQGIRECIDDNWIAYRVGQTQYLGELLRDGGIPIVTPVGGHAVFIDAKKFLPHIPQEQFPAQALASAIYLHSGVRTMERGIASAGRDRKTGKQHAPELELVRLTIPRRVYTQSHMDYVADKITELHGMRDRIDGLEITWEPAAGSLRFFLMRFSPRGGKLIR
jgi:tyrosine phenol-lyase